MHVRKLIENKRIHETEQILFVFYATVIYVLYIAINVYIVHFKLLKIAIFDRHSPILLE